MNYLLRILALVALTAVFAAPAANAAQGIGVQGIGDYPDGFFDPLIDVGCWRWNWQEHAYYNTCPVYAHPKAYMFPRYSRSVVRAKG